MFSIQSLFTRISHYKPSFVVLYGDILFILVNGSKVVHGTYLPNALPSCFINGASGLITKTKSAFIIVYIVVARRLPD